MIERKKIQEIVDSYDNKHITIGVLGGHSALDVCRGAKKHGFRTLTVCQKGREKKHIQNITKPEKMVEAVLMRQLYLINFQI